VALTGLFCVHSGRDAVAMMVDYATDKLAHPPLAAVETNLLELQRETYRLRAELRTITEALHEVGIEVQIPQRCGARIRAVQSERFTTVPRNASQCGV